MRRREFIMSLGGAVVVWPFPARAQQKSAGIGFLVAGTADASAPLSPQIHF
jgi:Tfp pilus assembly protein PilZ